MDEKTVITPQKGPLAEPGNTVIITSVGVASASSLGAVGAAAYE